MMQKKQGYRFKEFKKYILKPALCAATAMTLLTSFSLVPLAANNDFDQREAAVKQQQANNRAALAAAQKRANTQKGDFEKLKQEVADLKAKGKATEGEVEYLQGTFDKAMQELEQAQAEYDNSVAEVERQQKLYEDRLVAIFETQNDNNWLSILISSKNLEAMHTRYELSRIIADNDKQALENLETAMEYALHNQENAKRVQDQADKLLKNAQAQLENLRHDISLQEQNLLEKSKQLKKEQANVANLQSAAANYEEQLKQIGRERQAEAKRQAEARLKAQQEAARQAAAKGAAGTGAGARANAAGSNPDTAGNYTSVSSATASGWVWPNTYSRTITCPFGYGDNVLSNSYFHRGVDLQAAFGSKIVAALPGTVTKAYNPYEGQNYSAGSYGNYVVIDHGNGLVTLYGHMKSVQVQVGQHVEAGQMIGLAGSTGNSTGPHLHFEVQVNGNLQNPMNYIGG